MRGGLVAGFVGLVALAGLAVVGAAEQTSSPPNPAFERVIRPAGLGLAALALDGHVYEAARADLADLRVESERGEAVPLALDRGRPAGPVAEREPRMRNRGTTRDGAATAVLDFGERTDKVRLSLRLSGRNFRRRVAVEGSDDGQAWASLTDEAWVFAIPAPEPVRYETVTLPENDFPLLRVRVHPGPDERERITIERAWVPAGDRPPRRETTLAPRWSRADDARSGESWLTLDLGARYQPFHAVVLDVDDERFFREVRVEARREVPFGTDGRPRAVTWVEVGRGVVYRLEHDGRLRECLGVEARGRERVIRLRILNRDDRPLRVRNLRVRIPVERLLFEAKASEIYRLTYGDPDLSAPSYDLARTLGTGAEAPSPVELGPPIRREARAEPPPPWTERHPALLWGGLLAVVVALGALTWRALRAA